MSDTPKTETLIEAQGIGLRIGKRQILEDVDLAVHAGEIVTLVGLNGAGKSTLIRVLLGQIRPSRGKVIRAPGLRIGYSPQQMHRDRALPMTVRRFLTLGAPATPGTLEELMAEVGTETLLDRPLAAISGGELQRILLARALLRKPDLLVLDEPLGNVDIASHTGLYQLIGRIRDRHGCGVLLVSHDLHLVMATTDTVLCLDRHVRCAGHLETIVEHPDFVSLFGEEVAGTLAVYVHAHSCPDHVEHQKAGEKPLKT